MRQRVGHARIREPERSLEERKTLLAVTHGYVVGDEVTRALGAASLGKARRAPTEDSAWHACLCECLHVVVYARENERGRKRGRE